MGMLDHVELLVALISATVAPLIRVAIREISETIRSRGSGDGGASSRRPKSPRRPKAAAAPKEEIEGRASPGVHKQADRSAWGMPLVVTGVATLVGGVLISFYGAPTAHTEDSFREFFGSCAQVLVGLLIAAAIELRSVGLTTPTGEPRSDALMALIAIVLGQALSLAALFPDCPRVLFSVATVVVPATMLGALVAMVSLASIPRTSNV